MDPVMQVRPARPGDAAAISAIYNHYITHSTATFREELETVAERSAWLADHQGGHAVLVAEETDGSLAGWAALSPFHARSAYRFTAENSIYLRDDRRGRGLGGHLLAALLDHARAHGFHPVLASITAEQEASLRLHHRLGFVETARLRQVGRKFERWLDVVYLQYFLAEAS